MSFKDRYEDKLLRVTQSADKLSEELKGNADAESVIEELKAGIEAAKSSLEARKKNKATQK